MALRQVPISDTEILNAAVQLPIVANCCEWCDIKIEAMPIGVHGLCVCYHIWYIAILTSNRQNRADTIQLHVVDRIRMYWIKAPPFAVIDLIKWHSRVLVGFCVCVFAFRMYVMISMETIHTAFKIELANGRSPMMLKSVEWGWLNYALHWHPIKIKCRSTSVVFLIFFFCAKQKRSSSIAFNYPSASN